MMGWTLILLVSVAVLLLILSLFKEKRTVAEREIEQFSISMMEEVQLLQRQIRTIELDSEILAQEVGLQSKSSDQRVLLREILDLYKRGYSIEGIALETKQTENEIKLLLTPYMVTRPEGRQVANDS